MRRAQTAIAAGLLLAAAACDSNVAPTTTAPAQLGHSPGARVLPAQQAIEQANIATLDPEEMAQAEIEQVVPGAEGCRFLYTRAGKPVLAVTPTEGVIKVNGALIALTPEGGDPAAGAVLRADGVEVVVTPIEDAETGGWRTAHMEFALAQGLHVGYRGAYGCGAAAVRGP